MWAESLAPDDDTQTLAGWSAGPFAGMAALTERAVGAGTAAYWGWRPSVDEATEVLALLADRAGVARLAARLPDGMLRIERGARRLVFNFTDHAEAVEVDGESVIVPPRDLVIF